MKVRPSLIFYMGLGLASGCTFNFEITSQRTALENQVMGIYQELDDEVLLLSTMRGLKRNENSEQKVISDVLYHKQNQNFNKDDIEEMKDKGWVGEMRDGRLGVIDKHVVALKSESGLTLMRLLVSQENRDREAIWRHVLARTGRESKKGLEYVGRIFGDMQIAALSAGQWYEGEARTWRKKTNSNE